MASEGTNMIDTTQKEQCERGCTKWGGGIGLASFLLFWLIFGWGFFMAIIVGVIFGVVATYVLKKQLCDKIPDRTQDHPTPAAPAPTDIAATPARPNAPADAASDIEPTNNATANKDLNTLPSDTTDGQSTAPVGGAASEATAGTSPAAAAEPKGFSGIKPSAPLKGQAELAARKGTYKYQAPKADPVSAKPSAPDQSSATAPVGSAAQDVAVKTDVKPADAPAAVGETAPELLSQPRDGRADNLKLISGVGPKFEQALNELGFYHFDQIANWTPQHVAWVDARVKFKGRIQRDNWMAQAATLAASGETAVSARSKKT